jgi:hypothetical protein
MAEQVVKSKARLSVTLIAPVPIAGVAGHDEDNYMPQYLHASWRKRNPHKNSTMLRMPKMPGLLKSKKLLLFLLLRLKATCWKRQSEVSPRVSRMKRRTHQKLDGLELRNLVEYCRKRPWNRSSLG